MQSIKFVEDREFDYGDGPVLHRAGDKVAVHDGAEAMTRDSKGGVKSLRTDKAQRWVVRKVAEVVGGESLENAPAPSPAPGPVPSPVTAPASAPVPAPASIAAPAASPAQKAPKQAEKAGVAKKSGRRK